MKLLKSLLMIALGSALVAFGIINFAVLNHLADGGFTGITIILYHAFGISTALANTILNIPVLILGYRLFSKRTFWFTVYGTLCLSLFLRAFEVLGPLVPALSDDMILASLSYGLTVGIGMGIIFQEDATTGGADIIAKLIKDKAGFPMSKTILIFDTSVIVLSLLTFLTFTHAIYTVIGIYLCSLFISRMTEGFQSGYKVLIHTKQTEALRQKIIFDLNRGVTLFYGEGGYSKAPAQIIMVAISKKQLIPLKRLIEETDPHAFITVSHTYETIGEGFTFFVD